MIILLRSDSEDLAITSLTSFSTFFSFYFYMHQEVNAFEMDSFESEMFSFDIPNSGLKKSNLLNLFSSI